MIPGTRHATPSGRIGRLALALAVALAGIWVGSETLSAYIARTNLGLAASLDRSNAAILGLRAHADLEAGNVAAARRLAFMALRRDPTVLPAIQTLGLSTGGASNFGQAARLLAYAQRLSRRNLQTHLWAIEYSVNKGDISGALASYDRALRTSIVARDVLFPVLASAAGAPAIARVLAVYLGRKPLWYDAFLWFIGSDTQVTPATAVRLFSLATRAGAPVQPAALSALVSRSLDTEQYGEAWAAYALLRPGADRRHVRNSSFRHLADVPAAFDWTLASDGSIQAQSDGTDLIVEAGSGATGVAVQQRQMLPVGRYQLSVTNGAVPVGAALIWSLSCQSGLELARLSVTAQSSGRKVSPVFSVPIDCSVQNLALTADASEVPTGLRVVVKNAVIAPLRAGF